MTAFLILFIMLGLVAAVMTFIVFLIYTVIIGDILGAPFVSSSKEKVKRMVRAAGIKHGERVYDLGSGDGILLFEAIKQGAQTIGFEVNPFLTWWSRFKARRLKVHDRMTVHRKNFLSADLRDADVVFMYLWPKTNARLREKLKRELKAGARVVSNVFPIPGWTVDIEEDGIFVYHIKG